MTTSKNGRLIYVHSWTLGSHERAENEPVTIKCAESYQPITNECAESYQPITNEWSLGSRGCAENIFAKNKAGVVVVVRQKQHGRESNTIHIASRRSCQDPLDLLTSCLFLKVV